MAESNEERIKRVVAEHKDLLNDPRMADDYNPETGERDGIKYWERTARVEAGRAEQGLPARIEDPGALARLTSILRRARRRSQG